MSDVAANLRQIRNQIAKLAPKQNIQIIGVAKFQPIERLKEAVEAGVTALASNYAQEGETFLEALKDKEVEWHFIGHIQSRKVKFLPAYQWVQSLDRIEIAKDLDARLTTAGKVMRGCVEVNIGEEPQKSGVAVDRVQEFLEAASRFPSLKIEGLMCMPPFVELEARRSYFKKMHSLYDRLSNSFGLKVLSMGTSDDYLVAIEEGSNMVRLGTCLFGSRPAL